MTKKEWKELCEWAKTLEKTAFVRVYEDNIAVEGLEFTKCGDIECNYGEYCLVKNRTTAQIKSIIENLL